jgi:long-chain acyl-CoA synthetase
MSVLESHPPSAIITSSEFLSHLIELIYDSAEPGYHTVIVVGEPDLKAVGNSKGHVKFLRFGDLEREGAKIETVMAPPQG